MLARATLAACVGLLSMAAASAYEPHINYMLNCMGCHAPDGRGDPGHVPDIRGTLAPFAADEAGRRFMTQVPGAALSRLTDAELAGVLNWMVDNLAAPQVPPASLKPFTAQEIAAWRATPLVDVTAARRQLLAHLAQDK
ncbi:MAG: hypothetical protein JSR67_14915 [Proteobacteria bacterium]|nr:hypothetical protein [Pseudomonadota bacterium]